MRIKLCKSRYFWLTHNTWGQLYRVFFFCEQWNWWCLVPYWFVLSLSALLTLLSPAVPLDLCHISPSPISPSGISFSLPSKQAAVPGLLGPHTLLGFACLHPATKFHDTQTAVPPSALDGIGQLVRGATDGFGDGIHLSVNRLLCKIPGCSSSAVFHQCHAESFWGFTVH